MTVTEASLFQMALDVALEEMTPRPHNSLSDSKDIEEKGIKMFLGSISSSDPWVWEVGYFWEDEW